jgi:putative tryptophan/tyrosine transport system substrate-binding protein
MRRREFIAGLGGAAAWPLAARAQQRTRPIIGMLDGLRLPPYLPLRRGDAEIEGFYRGLAEVGFLEGDITIDYGTTGAHPERVSALAADLVRRRPAAILTVSGFAASALKASTRDIPVIFALGADPIELGLAASFSRPGGNFTGLVVPEIAEKHLQLLHEAAPAAETIALLVGSGVPDQMESRHIQSAARTLGLHLLVFNISFSGNADITQLFATLVGQQAGAVLISGSIEVRLRSNEILSHAARFALPTMFVYPYFARAGGLLSYGPDYSDVYRQLGVYTGRILKGEKPGDIPVTQPLKFEFVINLKTAKALGLTMPTNLLVRADEVIEE